MQRFTELFLKLDQTTRTSEKLEALREYFKSAPLADSVWAVYLMTGHKIGRTVSATLLRKWVGEEAGLPAWLVDECYHLVGDLSETISLLAPAGTSAPCPPALHVL